MSKKVLKKLEYLDECIGKTIETIHINSLNETTKYSLFIHFTNGNYMRINSNSPLIVEEDYFQGD